jgi:iron complex outermembrane receptor protein
VDADFQHHFKLASRHDLVWGLGVRSTEDKTTGSETITLNPPDRTQRQYSGFIQDEIRLYRQKVYLTLGTKVEKNSFSQSNTEWSPNVRLSWLMNETNTVWASIAKAVRTPSRVELDGRILGSVEPPFSGANTFPVPFAITINGNPMMDSEEVIAYEIGYRAQPARSMTLDVAFFYNDYKDLRTLVSQGVFCQPAGLPISDPACFFGPIDYAELPLIMTNQIDLDTKGMEISMSYEIRDWWRMYGAYSYLKIEGGDQVALPVSAGEDSPEHQLSLRSSMNINASTELDFWMRYVDELQIQKVDSYVTLDARLNWAISNAWQVSLAGRNLLDSSHLEFREEFGLNQAVEIEREFIAEIRLQF